MKTNRLLILIKTAPFFIVLFLLAVFSNEAYAANLTINRSYEGSNGVTVFINYGSGSASCSSYPCTVSVPDGANVTLTHNAPSFGSNDFHFIGWSGSCVGISNSCSFNMNSNKTVTIALSNEYTVTAAITYPADPRNLIIVPPNTPVTLTTTAYKSPFSPSNGVKWIRWCKDGPGIPGFPGCGDPYKVCGDSERDQCSSTITFTLVSVGDYTIRPVVEDKREDNGWACYGFSDRDGTHVAEPKGAGKYAWVDDCDPIHLESNNTDLDRVRIRVIENTVPTGAITEPPGAPGAVTVLPDVGRNYTGIAYDTDNNLTRVEMLTLKQNVNGTWNYAGLWQPFFSQPNNWMTCSAAAGTGSNCPLTRNWTPLWTNFGRYMLRVDSFDATGNKCTGNLVIPAGWNDCGPNDHLTVCVRAAPTAVTPIYPTNGLVSVGVPVNFSWNPAQFGFSCLHNVQPTGTYTMQYRAGSSGPWTNACTSTTLTACDNVVLNKGVTYQWRVGAYNGQDTTYGGPWSFTTENATPGWFTSTGGDVYGGITGIEMVTPSTIDGRWTDAALAQYSVTIPNIAGTVQAGKKNATDAGVIRVYRDTTPDDTRISEDDRYIKNMPVKNLGFKMDGGVVVPLTPPDGAVTLNAGILGNLNPDRVYKTGNAALISGGIDYDLQKNGVTVIYLTGTAPVTITGNIKSATNANRRILLVTNRDITISEDIGSPFSPGPGLLPHIEMGIVTTGSINFPSKAPNQGLDSTVVVEGPLAAGGAVTFSRSRDANLASPNAIPSEHVRYNARYLDMITAQERNSSTANYTGLVTNEIVWINH